MSSRRTVSTVNKDAGSVVTIDLQPLLVPFSIFISALMISVAIFFAGQSIAKSINPDAFDKAGDSGDSADTGDAGTGTAPTAVPATNGTTTIDDDPILGDPDAKVAIVEFSDYECPFCQRYWEQTQPQIKTNYIDTGKVMFVYRDLPLPFHDPAATKEAYAAECVRDQGGDIAYFKMHDKIFETTQGNGTGLTDDQIKQLAGASGVNGDNVITCINDEKFKDEVDKDKADATAAGINGTPGFIVGTVDSEGNVTGKIISGAQPYSAFEAAIAEALGE